MPQIFLQSSKLALAAFSVFLLASSAFGQSDLGTADDNATKQVIEDQLQAFGSGDHERAYSHASPNIRRLYPTVDGFVAMVRKGYGALYGSQGHVFGRSAESGGQIHREVIVTDSSGRQWQAVYTLQRQEDGSWKISGVKMEPFKGVSA